MSFFPARQVFDGLKNIFKNIPLTALDTVGIPSNTTVLYGDGVYRPPLFGAPNAPAYDNSAVSASSGILTNGAPFTFHSGPGTSGAYGIVEVNCLGGFMGLTADVEVLYGGIPMVSKGAVYNNNISTGGWSWVFVLDGIPGGDQIITVTPTLAGQSFAGNAASYSYLNVVGTGALLTAYGTGNPSLTVTPTGVGGIVWGTVNTGGNVPLTGFSLTEREFSTSTLRFYGGDTAGTGSVTVGGTASSTAWSIAALELLAEGLIPISALGATGTPSSTTFLRGDGTWNTPSGGGGSGSGGVVPVAVRTSDYTASAGKLVPCDLSGGAFAVTLPPAPADGTNVVIKIIKQATTPNTLTVACAGSDVFNVATGPTTGTMTLLNQAMRLQYYAASAIWYVISTDEPLSQLDARYVAQKATTFVEYIGNTSSTVGVTNAAVPSGIIGVEIIELIAPGSGGASGALSASGTIAGGGGGGGGGAVTPRQFIPAESLGSTYSVSIPAAGLGGAAKSSAGNGNAGGLPGAAYTTFTSGSLTVRSATGAAAAGGGTSTAGGTAGGAGLAGGIAGQAGGVGSSTTAAGSTGGPSQNGGTGGGGGGGGVTATPAASAGGPGGADNLFNTGAPLGGVVGGASPGVGPAALSCTPGAGAGGGAGATSGAAQAGASATGYGGGGGGGGGSIGTSSGAGGNGGPGYLGLRWIYS